MMAEQNDRELLMIESLREIAEQLGHSLHHPVSLGLLCLDFGITNRDREKILLALCKILDEDIELTYEVLKDKVHSVYPESEDFSDLTMKALLKAYAKNLIPELVPVVENFDDEL